MTATASGPDTASEVLAAAHARGLSHVSVGCYDWHGRLRAKQLHVRKLPGAFARGLAMTSAIFATDSAERPIENGPFQNPAGGYRDADLVFDAAIWRDFPLEAGGEGVVVLGQLGGEFARFCPRALLGAELARYAALGYTVRGAFELEFHLLRETPASLRRKVPARLEIVTELERMYSLVDHSAAATFFDALRALAERVGVGVDSLHAEFTALLEAALAAERGPAIADNAVLFKTAAKALARRHGLLASFMAKLSNQHETAGGHLNLSLERDGEAVFGVDSTGGATPALAHFIGGLQRHTPELMLLHCPYVNSFKRLAGESFAPRTNRWGIDNKTCAYRVVESGADGVRIELRLPGADVNPALCLLAALVAGRRGLERQLAPSAPATGNAWAAPEPTMPAFPGGFARAIAEFHRSQLAREALGTPFVEAFTQSREWQLEQLDRTVTDWELRQYGECV
ncbi:MAG: hypothetical protein HY943_13900 [Gammaproteobacteria bacterium]|nr:hypothetical protein [Gammaproteobacteria bacterium]